MSNTNIEINDFTQKTMYVRKIKNYNTKIYNLYKKSFHKIGNK